MRLLITGASGFIGGHLLHNARESGHDPCAVIRRPSMAASLAGAAIISDPASPEAWGPLLEGCEAVVHCAARAHRPVSVQRAEYDSYAAINTAWPLRLAEEAAARGVRRFVFVSTIGVHGATTDGGSGFREDSPIRPDTPYAETKARAEDGLRAIAQRTGLALTIIRPVMVYGPKAPGNFSSLAALVRSGLPLPFGAIRNRRAFVGVTNLTSLILHCLAQPAGSETLIAADDERPSTPDFIRALGLALGRKPVLFPVPPAFLRRLLGLAGRETMAQSLLGSLDVDDGAARRLGWRPALSLADGLADAVRGHGPAGSTDFSMAAR